MEILPGDVLFVWGSGAINEIVERVTHGPSHCALFLGKETIAEAQAGRKIGSASTLYYRINDIRCEVWRDDSLTPEDRKNIVKFAKSLFGTSYDYLAILAEFARFELNFPINSLHEGKRRICSSYVYDCAKSVGKEWTNVKTPAPVDLLGGGKLTLKGALKNAG